MEYAKEDIIKDVRVALEENAKSAAILSADKDVLTLESVIESCILRGIHLVETEAPVEFIDGATSIASSTLNWFDGAGQGGGYITLPTDFMRMVVFKMSDWDVAVYDYIDVTSPGYMMQKSKLKGIKGNPEKPVCAIVNHPDGIALEFYSSYDASATPDEATYLPEPSFSTDDKVSICKRCYNSCVYRIAALVHDSYGRSELAKLYEDVSGTLLS